MYAWFTPPPFFSVCLHWFGSGSKPLAYRVLPSGKELGSPAEGLLLPEQHTLPIVAIVGFLVPSLLFDHPLLVNVCGDFAEIRASFVAS